MEQGINMEIDGYFFEESERLKQNTLNYKEDIRAIYNNLIKWDTFKNNFEAKCSTKDNPIKVDLSEDGTKLEFTIDTYNKLFKKSDHTAKHLIIYLNPDPIKIIYDIKSSKSIYVHSVKHQDAHTDNSSSKGQDITAEYPEISAKPSYYQEPYYENIYNGEEEIKNDNIKLFMNYHNIISFPNIINNLPQKESILIYDLLYNTENLTNNELQQLKKELLEKYNCKTIKEIKLFNNCIFINYTTNDNIVKEVYFSEYNFDDSKSTVLITEIKKNDSSDLGQSIDGVSNSTEENNNKYYRKIFKISKIINKGSEINFNKSNHIGEIVKNEIKKLNNPNSCLLDNRTYYTNDGYYNLFNINNNIEELFPISSKTDFYQANNTNKIKIFQDKLEIVGENKICIYTIENEKIKQEIKYNENNKPKKSIIYIPINKNLKLFNNLNKCFSYFVERNNDKDCITCIEKSELIDNDGKKYSEDKFENFNNFITDKLPNIKKPIPLLKPYILDTSNDENLLKYNITNWYNSLTPNERNKLQTNMLSSIPNCNVEFAIESFKIYKNIIEIKLNNGDVLKYYKIKEDEFCLDIYKDNPSQYNSSILKLSNEINNSLNNFSKLYNKLYDTSSDGIKNNWYFSLANIFYTGERSNRIKNAKADGASVNTETIQTLIKNIEENQINSKNINSLDGTIIELALTPPSVSLDTQSNQLYTPSGTQSIQTGNPLDSSVNHQNNALFDNSNFLHQNNVLLDNGDCVLNNGTINIVYDPGSISQSTSQSTSQSNQPHALLDTSQSIQTGNPLDSGGNHQNNGKFKDFLLNNDRCQTEVITWKDGYRKVIHYKIISDKIKQKRREYIFNKNDEIIQLSDFKDGQLFRKISAAKNEQITYTAKKTENGNNFEYSNVAIKQYTNNILRSVLIVKDKKVSKMFLGKFEKDKIKLEDGKILLFNQYLDQNQKLKIEKTIIVKEGKNTVKTDGVNFNTINYDKRKKNSTQTNPRVLSVNRKSFADLTKTLLNSETSHIKQIKSNQNSSFSGLSSR